MASATEVPTMPDETPDAGLRRVLEATAREIEGVRSVVVGDASGLPIGSAGRGGPSLAATAMATLAMTAANKVTASLGLDGVDDILIEAGAWTILVRDLGHGRTLSVVFPAEANLGFIRIALTRHSAEIRELLDELG